MKSPEAELAPAAEELANRIQALPSDGERRLVAIAGAPASGKSLLARILADRLTQGGRKARVIPMDGFHLDNAVLTDRELLARKGAPETFDAVGFIELVKRIKQGGEVFYPVFDRSRDLAVAGAAVLDRHCDTVIVEGNYLLFDEPPWSELPALWDLSVWLETPEEVVRERCVKRWLDHDHTQEEAEKRTEQNDIRNARRIEAARMPASVTLKE